MTFLHRKRTGLALTFAAALSLGLPLTTATKAAAKDGPIAVDAELVLAVDISRSMNRPEQELQRAGYVAALSSPEFAAALKAGPNGKIAITYMEWSTRFYQQTVIGWTVIDSAESAKAFAGKLAAAPYHSSRFTSISGAIDASVRSFADDGVNSSRRIIDISGDGPNNDGRLVTAARDDAVAAGITINGLPLDGVRTYNEPADIKNLTDYYKECVVGGADSFVIPVKSQQDFVVATRTKLVKEVAGIEPQPADERAPIIPAQALEPTVSCEVGEEIGRRAEGS